MKTGTAFTIGGDARALSQPTTTNAQESAGHAPEGYTHLGALDNDGSLQAVQRDGRSFVAIRVHRNALETHALLGLHHAHVLHAHDVFETEKWEHVDVIVPYLGGGTVGRYAASGELVAGHATLILLGVLAAWEQFSRCGWAHLRLDSRSVLLTEQGRPVVVRLSALVPATPHDVRWAWVTLIGFADELDASVIDDDTDFSGILQEAFAAGTGLAALASRLAERWPPCMPSRLATQPLEEAVRVRSTTGVADAEPELDSGALAEVFEMARRRIAGIDRYLAGMVVQLQRSRAMRDGVPWRPRGPTVTVIVLSVVLTGIAVWALS